MQEVLALKMVAAEVEAVKSRMPVWLWLMASKVSRVARSRRYFRAADIG